VFDTAILNTMRRHRGLSLCKQVALLTVVLPLDASLHRLQRFHGSFRTFQQYHVLQFYAYFIAGSHFCKVILYAQHGHDLQVGADGNPRVTREDFVHGFMINARTAVFS